MLKRQHVLTGLCGLMLAAAAWGQDVPPNPKIDFTVRGAPGGGIIILNVQAVPMPPQLIPGLPQNMPNGDGLVPIDLPIVNEGFANDADVKGSIKPLVDALHSADYGRREESNAAMLRLPPGRLTEVVDALAHATDAEAIERLTQIAAHLYLKPRTLLKTRASVFGVWHKEPNLSLLGLKFRLDPVKLSPTDGGPTMSVMVTEIQPGFPAMQVLRNGDRIVAMGGVGFPPELPQDDSTYFRSRVAMLWPGSVVPMIIWRDGKLIELGVEVAGLPLNGPVTPDAMVALRQAALEAFLRSLKTGDGSQAMATPEKPYMLIAPGAEHVISGDDDIIVVHGH